MDSTSDDDGLLYANEQVTPFFTRAQIFAFTQPISEDALKKVSRGGTHDYVPHEYIRALLDRFIGPGRWELQAVLHSTDKEIVKKNEKGSAVEKIAATAIVNVTLTIFGANDPSLRLTYKGVGSHTMYAGMEAGYGSVIGNAIDAAESDGVKAAAKNLGKAFGFDLKNKLDKKILPPSIAQYAAELAGRRRKSTGQQALPSSDSGDAASPDVKAAADAQSSSETEGRDRPHQDAAPTGRGSRSEAAGRQADPTPKADKTDQRGADVPAGDSGEVRQSDGQASGTGPAAAPNWELSVIPSTYQEWVQCIRTMKLRINAMNSDVEISNFVRRNRKLIDKLPILPSANGKPPADFKGGFSDIVARRYEDLNLEVPVEYRREREMESAK